MKPQVERQLLDIGQTDTPSLAKFCLDVRKTDVQEMDKRFTSNSLSRRDPSLFLNSHPHLLCLIPNIRRLFLQTARLDKFGTHDAP
jgi:hypothetical protein